MREWMTLRGGHDSRMIDDLAELIGGVFASTHAKKCLTSNVHCSEA